LSGQKIPIFKGKKLTNTRDLTTDVILGQLNPIHNLILYCTETHFSVSLTTKAGIIRTYLPFRLFK